MDFARGLPRLPSCLLLSKNFTGFGPDIHGCFPQSYARCIRGEQACERTQRGIGLSRDIVVMTQTQIYQRQQNSKFIFWYGNLARLSLCSQLP